MSEEISKFQKLRNACDSYCCDKHEDPEVVQNLMKDVFDSALQYIGEYTLRDIEVMMAENELERLKAKRFDV